MIRRCFKNYIQLLHKNFTCHTFVLAYFSSLGDTSFLDGNFAFIIVCCNVDISALMYDTQNTIAIRYGTSVVATTSIGRQKEGNH